jgi:hypothetical protein
VQSGSKANHVDLNLFADLVVTLNHIAHVMEGEIHNGGIIDVILAEVLICVLNTRASAMESTPAKTMHDLFMVFSLSVLAQVYTAAYARICGSRTFRQMSA